MPIFKPSTSYVVNNLYTQVKGRCSNSSANFAILILCPQTPALESIYAERATAHNSAFHTNVYADAGFDLFTPDRTVFTEDITSKFIDMRVNSEMFYCDVVNDVIMPAAFVVHPRSSLSKTPLMLANHTGIIDSGYRGSLIGAFRWLPRRGSNESEYVVDQSTRLLQICHPTLCPMLVLNVDSSHLSTSERSTGGFGSTGV
jgi:dUTP pyrophosphatase